MKTRGERLHWVCSRIQAWRVAAVLSSLLGAAPVVAGEILYVLADPGTNGVGSAVADAGDVDGDGVPDVIVGGYTWASVGVARVHSGVDGAELYKFQGVHSQSAFGYSVDGADDVDADGFVDLLVAAPGEKVSTSTWGVVRVFSGRDGSVLHFFTPGTVTAAFGTAAAGAGDVNQDGHADVMVGGPGSLFQGDFGNLWVFSGQDGQTIHKIPGDSKNGGMGQAVAARDINGDGHPDLIVSASVGKTDLGVTVGSVMVYSGVDASMIHRFLGPPTGSSFGRRLDVLDDLDQDGIPEILVGSRNDHTAGPSFGAAYMLSGATGVPLYTVYGEQSHSEYSDTLSAVGDLDGDGLQDFAVAARTYNSTEALAVGRVRVYSGKDGSALATWQGQDLYEGVGEAVAGIGDLNGDGRGEVLIGSGKFLPVYGSTQLGTVYSGHCAFLPVYGSGCPGSGGITPVLAAADHCYSPGEPLALTIHSALGGSVALLILGTAKAEIPVGACFLNVWPILPISLALPLGGFGAGTGNITVYASIPAGLSSGTLTMQAVVADLGVVQGASATNGLALVVP